MPATVFNLTKNTQIATNVAIADTFLSRLVGLLGRRFLSTDEGLIITRCQSIHMFFMRFPIDVVFISRDHRVVGLTKEIKPFQLSPIFFKSSYCLELCSGTIAKKNIALGDSVKII